MFANMEVGVPRVAGATMIDGSTPIPETDDLLDSLGRTQRWLLDRQNDDGHWLGELQGDTILESEYVLLMAYLGREREDTCIKLCWYIREHQLPDGGWSIYPGGPMDISASVKAYFALKITGMSPDHPRMVKAREAILAAGGAQQCNSYTRFYLALLGQISYDECPSVPPELTLLPARLGFSLYAMSAWTRTIVVPLSIISALKPSRRLADEVGIPELFRDDLPRQPWRRRGKWLSWRNVFLTIDRALKWAERIVPTSWRNPGLRAAHRWMIDHFEHSDGLGAIFPPMIYTVIVLDCLNYERDSVPMTWAIRQLEDLLIEEGDSIRVQPCLSPVWDTAIATIALADAGLPPYHPALHRAVRWILDREVRVPGDCHIRRGGMEPGGWHFQYRNSYYPDIDDTAMVLLALRRTAYAEDQEVREATERARAWLLAMQNRDGGWAAFDADIDNQVLTQVPFADHNAMLDPSCADITARVMEFLGSLGYRSDHPAIARGLDYLWRTQEPEGCWYGRWGVNYIYGTWQVLLGLQAIDFPLDDPRVQRAVEWLESVQQPSGGWGESCASYDDPSLKGLGEPTASQTAWAVLGLIAVGRAESPAVHRGIRFLIETQAEDGSWEEPEFTGTGFPQVFYLKYHLYRIYFPLMALARYRSAIGATPVANPGSLASRIPALPMARDV